MNSYPIISICLLLLLPYFGITQQFTFNEIEICKKSKDLLQDEYSEQINYILNHTIPALTNYLSNGMDRRYVDVKLCSRIDSILNQQTFPVSNEKVEEKMLLDLLQLRYLRNYSIDEWGSANSKKVETTQHIFQVTKGGIDFMPNFNDEEKEDYTNKLAQSTISHLLEDLE
ncbi:MAG: hypothetical protein P1U56_19700 [Saprospiraceae bacterium]|nr:hypothetical protein [Saprospiraceae bacterium]